MCWITKLALIQNFELKNLPGFEKSKNSNRKKLKTTHAHSSQTLGRAHCESRYNGSSFIQDVSVFFGCLIFKPNTTDIKFQKNLVFWPGFYFGFEATVPTCQKAEHLSKKVGNFLNNNYCTLCKKMTFSFMLMLVTIEKISLMVNTVASITIIKILFEK